ncbi:MAG TPA: GDSL-type esterase/lipase family protein [Plantibacter sp.]|uniref:GDSL-type esterase/lipase family protein n=1 Tax=Plantibacter sp. TaxID=1871045 RepID=UPI002CD94CE4|nr:GDSL-type esterase/lipase family protein [Plantibacter sp.]
MKLRLALPFAAALALFVATPALAGYPGATGDSITRAFSTCWFPHVDCPSNSWSTGTHYRQILAVNPAIRGRNHNQAVTGADMADLNGQVQGAVARGAEYVTILMGANDVCASREGSMTPTATFRAQFEQAMFTLTSGLPNAKVFVSSIPGHSAVWSLYSCELGVDACGDLSMLANWFSNRPWDVDRRARVRQRNIDYNTQLAEVCGFFARCRFDGNAVFNTAFVRGDITTRDYFHPSTAGRRSSQP